VFGIDPNRCTVGGASRGGSGLFVAIIVPRGIARLVCASAFKLVLSHHSLLDRIAALLIDRMSDVGVKFVWVSLIVELAARAELHAAVVAEAAAQMIFATAASAASHHFPAWHRHKQSAGPFNDFKVSYHKAVIERY
jgi:hypothetical protein